MSSDWDPYKIISLEKPKDESNFFAQTNLHDQEKTQYFGYSVKEETSNFFSAQGKEDKSSWTWAQPGNENKETGYWGYTNSKQTNFWSETANTHDQMGFGSESALFSLKARQDAFGRASNWSTADTEWSFTNVNAVMNINASISHLEGKRGGWAFGQVEHKQNWGWEISNSNSSSWGWDTPSASSTWGWDTPSNPGSGGSADNPPTSFAFSQAGSSTLKRW